MSKNFFGYTVAFLFLSFLVIFLDSLGWLRVVHYGVQTVMEPFEFVTYSAKNSLDDSVSFLTFWKSGEQRIKNLELRNLELLAEANRKMALERENEDLKKQLGVTTLSKLKQIPAEVLGVTRFMVINRGQNDGLENGDTVVYLDNFVGQIVKVEPHISFIKLSTDADLKIPVKIGSSRTVKGVTLGQFNSSIVLDQVAQNEEIKVDDLVFTSGDEGKLVPDLIVGKISRITSSQTDLFQRANIVPLITYDKLKTVFVVVN